MYLLDTNVISELRRPLKADRNVRAWSAAIPVAETYLSAITIFEIEKGALLVARSNPEHGLSLRGWIDNHILTRFEGRILPVDTAVALRCARLHVPVPPSERDSLIAATALVHGMKVVTRDVNDFTAMGVELVNPWNCGAHRQV